jgi:hypothetical protein
MKNLKKSSVIVAIVLLMAAVAFAETKKAPQIVPAFPGTLVNARYVYVASYDGDQFNPRLLPEDRRAIGTVQDALQKWGKFIIVYEPRQADIVMLVMSRPSEDVLAVYDGHGWGENSQYLWRMMGHGGLQAGESPFVTDLEKAFDQATVK